MKKKSLAVLFAILLIFINIKSVNASIQANCHDLKIGIGTNIAIKVTGNTNSLSWSSTNSSVVSVSNGTITGRAIGESYINVSNDMYESDTCKINVIEGYVPVDDISLDKTSDSITIGQTKKINASVSPSNASNKTITYTSEDTSIATVDSSGNVTGKKGGSTYIHISIENQTKLYNINVIDNISLKGISIESTKEITENGTGKLTVTYNPSNATNKKVTWESSDTGIVTVDSNGNLKAISPGTATITATSNDGNHKATSKVIVNAIDKTLKGISLDKTQLTLDMGKEETLTVTYNPNNAENKKVYWSSSNSRVAVVEEGKVKALKPGTTEIKATSDEGNHEAVCKVTVLSLPIEKIAFTTETLEVYLGSVTTLDTVSTPEDTAINDPIWTSSNEEVATVEDGVVTALSIGETIITVSDKDKKITASITINVVEKPEEALMITIEGYDLKFKPEIKDYTLTIGNETSLKITTNRSSDEITIGGNKDLKDGSIITITTKGKEKTTYVINIKKKGNYTIYFFAIISVLLFINIIRLLIINKRKKKGF